MKSLATINPNVQQPYKPEELDPESQKTLKALAEDIKKKEKELDRLNNFMDHPSIRKMPKEQRLNEIRKVETAIENMNNTWRLMLSTGAEKLEWEAKAISGKDIEVDPVLAEAARRKQRQEKARLRAAEKDLKTEQTTATKTQPVANIVKADSKWGELSNLSKHSFTWNGKEYNSVEHAYQTNKSGKFDRVTYQAYIDRPEALKIVGKFQADKGTNIQLMEDLYRQMLSENPDVAKLLKETEGFKLTHQLRNTDIWTNEMPKILEKLRNEINNPPQTFETVKRYTVDDVRANQDKIYIFGDNTEGWGKGGQAIIRDEPNAFGISTKDSPNQFMSDDNFEANKARIDADIASIKADGRPIVFPEDGIGTGRADLKNKAPRTYEYLMGEIEKLKGGTPEVKSETFEGKSQYTKIPDPEDLPGTFSFIDNTPPELKNSFGLMPKYPPYITDTVAKIGGIAFKYIAPYIDEEIIIGGSSKILQQGLKVLGLGAGATAVAGATGAVMTYELYWMLANLGNAVIRQIQGEAAEPGGVPDMLFDDNIQDAMKEDGSFANLEQLYKDYETWAKGSVAVQSFRGATGYDDPIEWFMGREEGGLPYIPFFNEAPGKGPQKVNFYGYNQISEMLSKLGNHER